MMAAAPGWARKSSLAPQIVQSGLPLQGIENKGLRLVREILQRLQKICCAATCLDLNSAYKLLHINIKQSFIYETKDQLVKCAVGLLV
jgi:hypothetical protein